MSQTVILNYASVILPNGIFYLSFRVPARDCGPRTKVSKPEHFKTGARKIVHPGGNSLPSIRHTFQTIFNPTCDPIVQVT